MKSWLRIATALACGSACRRQPPTPPRAPSRPPTSTCWPAISDPQVSPDGRYVVYVQRETDLEANRGRTDLWLLDLDERQAEAAAADAAFVQRHASALGGGRHQHLFPVVAHRLPADLAPAADRRRSRADHRLSARRGARSAFRQAAGASRSAWRYSRIAPISSARASGSTPLGKKKETGRIFDSLFVRHWDTWNGGTRSNLFVAPVNTDGRAGAPVNVSQALDADVPSKPDGGDEEYTFSPDGARVVFSARVAGREEAWSTNFDLYEAPSDGSAAPRNLTADNPAWDTQPVYLRNGDLAWLAMSRPGFEADRFRIKIMQRRRGARSRAGLGPLGAAPRRGARRPHAARHRERPRADAAVFAWMSTAARATPDLRQGLRRRLRADAARHGGAVARSRLASRSLSTAEQWRAAPADERERGNPRGTVRSAHSSSSASRAGTTKPCTATS